MRPLQALIIGIVGLAFLTGPLAGDDKKPDAKSDGTKQQQAKQLDREIKVHVRINYLLYLPEEYGITAQRMPLMIFLHGAGETGNNLEMVKKHGPPKLVENKKDFPFVVVSPQASTRGWNVDALNALLDDVLANYKVDPNRVYLTGLSMGGYGTWSWAAANPERFAAIAPICGGGNPASAGKLKSIPAWVFHGGKDPVVNVSQSESMVKAIKEAGGDVKLTIYPDAGHDSWTETYDNPELYTWLLQHKRPAK